MNKQTSQCCFWVGAFCLLLFLCGCTSDFKPYRIYAENQSNKELSAVKISFMDSDFNFEFGNLVHGIWAGYGPCDPQTIPENVKLSWEQSGAKFEKQITVPQPIREKIQGNMEALFFRIGENEKVDVYVKIWDLGVLGKSTYFPAKFGKNQDENGAD